MKPPPALPAPLVTLLLPPVEGPATGGPLVGPPLPPSPLLRALLSSLACDRRGGGDAVAVSGGSHGSHDIVRAADAKKRTRVRLGYWTRTRLRLVQRCATQSRGLSDPQFARRKPPQVAWRVLHCVPRWFSAGGSAPRSLPSRAVQKGG